MQRVLKTTIKAIKHNWQWFGVGVILASIGLPLIIYSGFYLTYRQRVFPGVTVGGVNMGGLTQEEVVRVLTQAQVSYLQSAKLSVTIKTTPEASESAVLNLSLEEMGVSYRPGETARKIFDWGREGELATNLASQWQAVIKGVEFKHDFAYDREAMDKFLETATEEIDQPGSPASINWLAKAKNGSRVEVFRGENGLKLDREEVIRNFVDRVANLDTRVMVAILTPETNVISEAEAGAARERAEKLAERKLAIKLTMPKDGTNTEWVLTAAELVPLLSVQGGFERASVEEYVVTLAEAVNRDPQNALFKFEEGRVSEFAPSLDGVKLDEVETTNRVVEELVRLEQTNEDKVVEAVAGLTPPKIATDEVNNLGIKELIGKGESTFYHSIPGRVHNVALTASKLNGVLVPRDELFSFNKTIGDVSSATGYQPAYVIKEGRTVLGDGGGVCQDSTTLFRAILDAGLPVLERQAHAYRVSYYEQNSDPGFDATVYAPSPDLVFKNDTPGYILIQTKVDTKNLSLVVELYGTSDGRKSEIKNYQKWGFVPAPPPLYQDDPTLGPGVVKQVDWAATGLRVKFDYLVIRDGETIFEKTFLSNYKPWQAVYLRGI